MDVSHTQREPRLVGGVFVCFHPQLKDLLFWAPWSRDAVKHSPCMKTRLRVR